MDLQSGTARDAVAVVGSSVLTRGRAGDSPEEQSLFPVEVAHRLQRGMAKSNRFEKSAETEYELSMHSMDLDSVA